MIDGKRNRMLFVAALAAVTAGFLLTVALMPDGEGAWWVPRCFWLALTGTQCPACGTTRAVYALLHGDVVRAWELNHFFFVGTPLALVCIALWLVAPHSRWLWRLALVYVLLFVLWWPIRNIFCC